MQALLSYQVNIPAVAVATDCCMGESKSDPVLLSMPVGCILVCLHSTQPGLHCAEASLKFPRFANAAEDSKVISMSTSAALLSFTFMVFRFALVAARATNGQPPHAQHKPEK